MWPFPSATSTSWASPDWPRNLNFSNRPVRTRMPGGVAGVLEKIIRGPYADGVLVSVFGLETA